MGPRLSVAAGLAAGGLLALAIVAGVILFGPEIVVPAPSIAASSSPAPSIAEATPSAAPTASPELTAVPSAAPSGDEVANFHIGEQAPDLVVPQVGGGTIDLSLLEGKPVWVNFMQTTCEECITEFPQMNGFAARYGEEGLVILAIDIREEEGTVAAFAQSLNATFPLGLDADGTAQRAWGAFALPIHYWVDAAGVVRDGALGGIGPDIMARGVQAIMPDIEVTPE
ncbi:MAG TPA: TlpA disulfide reductase family protein [Candidatus Limnocylindrales bacterium]